MNFFWVNIGNTYNEVIEGNFLWAPKNSVNKSGKIVTHKFWDNVNQVRAGDIIFCYFNQQINFIAKATTDAYDRDRPTGRSFKEWDEKGYGVDVALTHLEKIVNRDEISADFIAQFDERTIPSLFTSAGTVNQIYMSRLPPDAGLFLLEKTQQIQELHQLEDKLIESGSTSKKGIGKTTREALVQARLGQGKFRRDLIKHWQSRCALTGLKNLALLTASHIDGWARCDNNARLDPDNGLLLATHIDKLFDLGLISFSDAGDLFISKNLGKEDCKIFGLDQYKKLTKITSGNRIYLAKHRHRFGFE